MDELTNKWYSSKWSLTDLYPECESKLRALLDSGEDFSTGPCYCSKELRSATYRRQHGNLIVQVLVWMDDISNGDLIADAVYDRFEAEADDIMQRKLFDNLCDHIKNGPTYFSDTVLVGDVLTTPTSYEDLMAVVDRLETEAEKRLELMYQCLCDEVEAYINHERSSHARTFD